MYSPKGGHAILVIILCACCVNARGQSSTRYDTCSALQALQGEWQYNNGFDTIRVYLRLHRSRSRSFNQVSDDLLGWIEYKKGNNIIESTYKNRFNTIPYETDNLPDNFSSLILQADSCYFPVSRLFGYLTDFSQGKEIKKVNTVLDVTGNVMNWRQDNTQGYGFFSGYFGMTLPKEFTLVKQ
jgi:hypothetical protein